MSVAVIFGGFSLQNERYITQEVDVYGSASKSISQAELARDDGAVSYARRLNSKTIVANGVINTQSTMQLEQAIDDLKKACNRDPTYLDVGYLDGYRRYSAEVQNVIIKRGQGDITIAAFSVEFYCDKPYATDPDVSTFIPQQTLTLATNVLPIMVGGTYKAEPLIEMNISGVMPNDVPVALTISNPATAQAITVTKVFEDNDTISLDTYNKNIYINNELTDYKGQMPKFDPGDGTLEVSDTGTARTIVIDGQYNKRYL